MSIPALHARKLANSGVSGAGAARPLYFKNLPTAGISALTAAQIGGMYSLEMAALSANQIKAFEPQALAAGLTTYLNNKKALPANFIGRLGNNQISQFGVALVSATLSKMSTTQIGAISTSAVSGIGNAALQSLSGTQLGGFTQLQVNQLSNAQVGSLKSQQVSAVSAAWLNKLSSAQLQSVGPASIGALTKAQVAGLDTAHVQYLTGPSKINLVLPKLSGGQIGVINATTVADISLDLLKKLSNDQLQGFTANQFSHFTKENINWLVGNKLNIGFSSQQMEAITARNSSANVLNITTSSKYINTGDGDEAVTLGGSSANNKTSVGMVDLGNGINTITTKYADVDVINSGWQSTLNANLGYGYVKTLNSGSSDANVDTGSSWVGAIHTFNGNDTVLVGGGHYGDGWAVDSINLGNGNNKITTTTGGVTSITANGGNDTLIGGSAAGNQWGSAVEMVNLGGGNNYVSTAEGWIGHIVTYDGNDTVITGSGSNSNNSAVDGINLGHGNNTITTGSGWVGSIQTYNGADTVSIGSGGSDQINLGKGNNTITTTTGWVGSIRTYSGDDTLTVGAGDADGWAIDSINLGRGTNTVTTTTGWVGSIQTYGGVDTVTIGSGGADQIALGGGNDTLIINTQAFKAGTSGVAGQGSVLAQGGGGTDTVDFSAVTKDLTVKLDAGYVESAGLGKLSLTAFEILKGGGGNDQLVGSTYDETISGGLGRDVLTGGAGADKFLFNAMETSANRDTITDFAVAEDKIQFSKSVFTGLTGNAVTAAMFATAMGAMMASTRLIYNSATGVLSYDADGSGSQSRAIEIARIGETNHPQLGATDFEIVA